MAQKDEYVNSDTSNGRSKELVNDPLQPIYHTNVATAKFQGFPLEIHNESSSSSDDDDFESDPIMNMISKQKTSLHKFVPSESLDQRSSAHHNKDPNRFLKAMEARASQQTDATVSSSTTQSKDTSVEQQVSAVPSLGITDKMERMKSSFFNPSQFKTQLLSRIPFHPLKYDEEEAVPQDSMRTGEDARKVGHNSSQPVVLSTSILRPEETMELIRLQAATRSSCTNSNLLLFFYFLQDKLVQHRCMAVIGLLVIFVYVIKGMFLNRVYS
jgi:hypothetical protein